MLVRVDNEERMEEQQKRKKGVAYTLELRAQEIAALKARITELEGERGRLREVCERLIIAQRFFEVKAGQPGRMPGNDFYSEKLMEVVNMAKSALADPAPDVAVPISFIRQVIKLTISASDWAIRYKVDALNDEALAVNEFIFSDNRLKVALAQEDKP